MRIKVCDGKYEFVFEDLKLSILRYNEPWLGNNFQGERAIIGLMQKLQELVSDRKDFEKLFAENINPATEKVTLSYAFLRALRERHADDQKRIAELENQLLSLKNEVLEKSCCDCLECLYGHLQEEWDRPIRVGALVCRNGNKEAQR